LGGTNSTNRKKDLVFYLIIMRLSLLAVSISLLLPSLVWTQVLPKGNHVHYLPDNVELIQFSEYQVTNVFDTNGIPKHVMFSLLYVVDSSETLWWNLTDYDNVDDMLKVSFWRFDEESHLCDTLIHGWIFKDNLAVYPFAHPDERIELFDSINVSNCIISFGMRDDCCPEVFKVVDVDLKSKWVKILCADGKEYWISYKNQCTNHYTSSMGA
jgi:hypothetical protein